MNQQAGTVLSQSALEAIAAGTYVDIFAVLGIHAGNEKNEWLIRVFKPGAKVVSVVHKASGRTVRVLEKIHPSGIFEATIKRYKNKFAYVLKVDGRTCEDPYRFAQAIDEREFYLFNEGTAEHAYQWLGAHGKTVQGVEGVVFTVWAPAAKRVSVVGDFNNWDGRQHIMRKPGEAGIWEIFIPDIEQFAYYKYEILDADGKLLPLKADPFARSMQHAPDTASRVVLNESFGWTDETWMQARPAVNSVATAVSIYEVHAGSWRRQVNDGNRYYSYIELIDTLIPYVVDMGFTHIQLMPISEYPFDGSWGYQPVGMYAPTIRFGTPDEFRAFVNACHQQNIGVLLDWVPGHFPSDDHGLGKFDGSCLYEHEDVRKGFHPDWNTLIFNYGRGEVMSYLLSNANYWLEEFHLDGLRVDAVASMLYLDYSRKEGEWLPNIHGGRENLEAIDLLQTINTRLYKNHPGILMIAEESTAWPGVSKPVDSGGLGFGYKWNMGWMNDSLRYMEKDPIHRQHHHGEMTFSMVYAFDENFILALSHDEVVHGKGSLINKMPGDEWQKFANLRAYYGFMWAHPGKKLLFMGCELAQRREWDHDSELDWHLLDLEPHKGVHRLVRDLNLLYRQTPALYELDCAQSGFQWLQLDKQNESIFAWLRKSDSDAKVIVTVVNMTPQIHHDYGVGVPVAGRYRECLNTDASEYGGSGSGNYGAVSSNNAGVDGQPHSIRITVPPLATVMFECERS